MPEYILEKHLPYSSNGWSSGEEFSAGNDEEAKRKAIEIIARQRTYYGDSRFRILKVTFDGLPHETGYPLPRDERYERFEQEQTALMADVWSRLGSRTLDDYDNLYFVLTTIPEQIDGAGYPGYHLRLLYGAGEGFMGHASEEEVENAREVAKLVPGDVTVSAYYIDGPEGAQCVSLSKVLSFESDGKTPKELIHLWPLEFPNIAITKEYLQKIEMEDKRE